MRLPRRQCGKVSLWVQIKIDSSPVPACADSVLENMLTQAIPMERMPVGSTSIAGKQF